MVSQPRRWSRLLATPILAIALAACSSTAASPAASAPASAEASAPASAEASAPASAEASAPASSVPTVKTPTGLPNPCVDASGATPTEKKRITIAVTFDVFDASRSAQFNAMQDVAQKISSACPNLQVVVTPYDSQNVVSKQISDIQTITLKKPDVLAVIATDPKGVAPAVQAAHDAGIKVIDFRGSMLDANGKEIPAVDASFHGADNPSYAAATVEWIKNYLDQNPGKNLKIGVIYGVASSTPNLIRGDAIKQLAKDMPDRISIVADAYGNWLANLAQSYTQTWLLRYPEMNMVTAANDVMSSGVAAAVNAANKKGQVLVTGYDLTDAGIDRIGDGSQVIDVGVLPYDYANVIYISVGLVQGTFEKRGDFTNKNVYKVTKETLADFLKTRKDLLGY